MVRTRDAGLPVYVRVTAAATGYVSGEAFTAPMTVVKLASKTTASVAVKKITQRDRAVINVFVEMVGFDAKLGSVRVTEGKKVLSTTALKTDGDGHVTIRLKKLKPGKHRLVVSYTGSTATSPSQARTVTVVVTSPRRSESLALSGLDGWGFHGRRTASNGRSLRLAGIARMG